jgi:hypothetical protein
VGRQDPEDEKISSEIFAIKPDFFILEIVKWPAQAAYVKIDFYVCHSGCLFSGAANK